MGVVHLFGGVDSSVREYEQKNDLPEGHTAQVINLPKTPDRGSQSDPIHFEMKAMLIKHGIDFSCLKVQNDVKIVTHLVQGLMDYKNGRHDTNNSIMLATMCHAFSEEPVPSDSDELFGDLLGQLDQLGKDRDG